MEIDCNGSFNPIYDERSSIMEERDFNNRRKRHFSNVGGVDVVGEGYDDDGNVVQQIRKRTKSDENELVDDFSMDMENTDMTTSDDSSRTNGSKDMELSSDSSDPTTSRFCQRCLNGESGHYSHLPPVAQAPKN